MLRERITSFTVALLVALPVGVGAQASRAPASPALSTDRPGNTENPFTIPLGQVQAEFDLANLERNARAGVQASRIEVGSVNVRVGVAPNVDLQVRVAPLVQDRVRVGAGAVESSTGIGDITFRAKVNIFGNDGEPTALGLIPFVSLMPTGEGSRRSRLGVIAPFSMVVGGGWDLGTMVVIGREPRDREEGHRGFVESSVAASHELSGAVKGFIELWNAVAAEPLVGWQSSANGGITWALGDSMQLDGGVNVGLTRATPALNPFLGFSVRF